MYFNNDEILTVGGSNMEYYINSRGENVIFDFILKQPIQEQVKLFRALKGLEDGSQNLNIKAFRKNVKELKVGCYRIFYTIKNSRIHIIHIIRKQSAKVQQTDVDLIINRSK